MRVIIAGSRDLGYGETKEAVNTSPWKYAAQEVVSGAARGVDKAGEEIAKEWNLLCKQFPADWDKYGKSAGYRRNEEMAQYANALIAVWDGSSRGTQHMITIMENLKKPVYVFKTTPQKAIVKLRAIK